MFVTNKTNGPLGVDGVIILRPLEQARFVPDEDDYKRRVDRLVTANLVSVNDDAGLVKYNVVEDKPEPIVESKPEPIVEPIAEPTVEPATSKKSKATSKTTEVI